MIENRIHGLIGLCVRSRQAVFGADGCLNAVRNHEAGLLLVDGDISPAALDKYRRACETHKIPLAVLPPGLIDRAAGRSAMAAAIKKGGLARSLIEQTKEQQQPLSPSENGEKQCGGASVE